MCMCYLCIHLSIHPPIYPPSNTWHLQPLFTTDLFIKFSASYQVFLNYLKANICMYILYIYILYIYFFPHTVSSRPTKPRSQPHLGCVLRSSKMRWLVQHCSLPSGLHWHDVELCCNVGNIQLTQGEPHRCPCQWSRRLGHAEHCSLSQSCLQTFDAPSPRGIPWGVALMRTACLCIRRPSPHPSNSSWGHGTFGVKGQGLNNLDIHIRNNCNRKTPHTRRTHNIFEWDPHTAKKYLKSSTVSGWSGSFPLSHHFAPTRNICSTHFAANSESCWGTGQSKWRPIQPTGHFHPRWCHWTAPSAQHLTRNSKPVPDCATNLSLSSYLNLKKWCLHIPGLTGRAQQWTAAIPAFASRRRQCWLTTPEASGCSSSEGRSSCHAAGRALTLCAREQSHLSGLACICASNWMCSREVLSFINLIFSCTVFFSISGVLITMLLILDWYWATPNKQKNINDIARTNIMLLT